MSDKPSSLRNLGPASDAFFAAAGITSAQQLHDLGPDEAYFRALKAGGTPHFIGFYAMVMGLQGRPWNDCRGKEKDQLKARYDAIKARLSDTDISQNALDKDLAAIGVVARKPTKS